VFLPSKASNHPFFENDFKKWIINFIRPLYGDHSKVSLNLVSSALSELPERTRYAFERHRVYGLAQKEVAKELGVSNTLVNFMIRDALAHCRKKVVYMNSAA
jgi:DNA-directed RNA polymerase specialized sigma24 family protein